MLGLRARHRPSRAHARVVRAAAELGEQVAGLSDDDITGAARRLRPAAPDASRADVALFLAIAREAAARTIRLRPFDEQLLASLVLLDGSVLEQDTGEGKTLVGAIAAAGQALSGHRVHVLSVNDYLATRDAAWMRPMLTMLGVTVGSLDERTPHDERLAVHRLDVVYAAVSEIGYDTLRDRVALAESDLVSPTFDVAIVDEADAAMIDEAMSPLVLAGRRDGDRIELAEAMRLAEGLEVGVHVDVDDDRTTATLTDAGFDLVEERLGGVLHDEEHVETLTSINLVLHARLLVHRDVDYIVQDGGIRLVHASRGRVALGQRWPDGLHAAVEAKEGIEVSEAGVILDSMTVHELLLRYRVRSGMSGTTVAVAEELRRSFDAGVARVERRTPCMRVDLDAVVARTHDDASALLVDEVIARHATGQPVLVGTMSVAASERIGELLASHGIHAEILNARNDADEAAIIARAGELGAVTVSTQMSGRGTDIRLGGVDEREHEAVAAAGGLAVIALGRFPSGRLDAQLRGRAGRQSDPGESIVIASLDDELVDVHAPEHLRTGIRRRGASMPMAERLRLVDVCQRISEGVRRDRHVATWAYHRAIAMEREAIMRRRDGILHGDAALLGLREALPAHVTALEASSDGGLLPELARQIALRCIDEGWARHLAVLQDVRDGIHLRALGGQDPLQEFHLIALAEFASLERDVDERIIEIVRGLDLSDLGGTIVDLGLAAPSSTWTYMMTDDPLGQPGDRFVRGLGARVRRMTGLEDA